ncbi:hypothetical protein GJAV_G00114760 [Gymnothorax javanicus]|nr:hypothetical protein GJAV_G00114760 [Gymnothorax javanicus]
MIVSPDGCLLVTTKLKVEHVVEEALQSSFIFQGCLAHHLFVPEGGRCSKLTREIRSTKQTKDKTWEEHDIDLRELKDFSKTVNKVLLGVMDESPELKLALQNYFQEANLPLQTPGSSTASRQSSKSMSAHSSVRGFFVQHQPKSHRTLSNSSFHSSQQAELKVCFSSQLRLICQRPRCASYAVSPSDNSGPGAAAGGAELSSHGHLPTGLEAQQLSPQH